MNKKEILIYKDEYILRSYSSYLTDLYLPIIGIKAHMLYLFLLDYKEEKIKERNLLKKLDLNSEDYLNALKILEGIDLIEYFVSKVDENDVIIYLNPVLPPSIFLERKYMSELLRSSINDDEEFNNIVKKYQKNIDFSSYKNESINFMEVFKVDVKIDETLSLKEEYIYSFKNKLKENREKDNDDTFNFSFAIFLKEVKKRASFNIKLITQKDEEKIERLAKIYNVKEDVMADLVVRFISLDKLNQENKKTRINYDKIEESLIKKSAINEYSYLNNENPNLLTNTYRSLTNDKNVRRSDLINYYISVSPIELLKDSMNGKEPSQMDKKIVGRLANEYNLNKEMINCIIHYALKRDNNHLYINNIINYLTPMIRNNIKDVYEMMDYLYKEKDVKDLENDIKKYASNNLRLNSLSTKSDKELDKLTKNSNNSTPYNIEKELTNNIKNNKEYDDIDFNLGLNDNDFDF